MCVYQIMLNFIHDGTSVNVLSQVMTVLTRWKVITWNQWWPSSLTHIYVTRCQWVDTRRSGQTLVMSKFVFKGYFLSEIICISNKIIFQYIAVSFIIDQSKVQGVIGAIFGWCTLGNKPLPVTSYIICCVIIPERKRPDAKWWYSYTIYLLSLISKLAGQQCGTKRFLKQ